MGLFEKQIIELFDANPTRAYVVRLAKMYNTNEELILEILQKNGRDINFKKGKLSKESEISQEEKKPQEEKALPMPEYVRTVLERELDSLDNEILQMEKKMADLKDKYKVLSDYLLK